jgi:universal stress protein E
MHRLPSILYVERQIAGCGRTLSCALEVARAFGARLTIAGVVDGSGSPVPLTPPDQDAVHLRWELRLRELVDSRSDRSVPVRTRILRGHAPEAITREVRRAGHGLVMKAADTSRIPGLRPIADTDRGLLRRCPCPIWILDPAEGPGLRLVLAAVDVSGGTGEMNARIVGFAASLARLMDAKLRVLHAWSILGEPILTSSMTGLSRRRVRSLRANTRRERRRRVGRLLEEEAPDLRVSIALPKGDPVRAVRREARRTEADVVVVGNATRKGFEALFFGNMAERLVGHIPGSVLALEAGAHPPLAASPSGEGAEGGVLSSSASHR